MRTRTLSLFPFPVTHDVVNGPPVPRDVAMRWVRRVRSWDVAMTMTGAVLRGTFADGTVQSITYSGQVSGACSPQLPDERPIPPGYSMFIMDRGSVSLSGTSSDGSPTGLVYYANTCLLWTLRTYPVDGVYPVAPMVSYDPRTGLYIPHMLFDLQIGVGGGGKQFILVGACHNMPVTINTGDDSPYLLANESWVATIDGYSFSVPGYCAWGKFAASGATWVLETPPTVTITLTPASYWPFAGPSGGGALYHESDGTPSINPATGVAFSASEIAAAPLP